MKVGSIQIITARQSRSCMPMHALPEYAFPPPFLKRPRHAYRCIYDR